MRKKENGKKKKRIFLKIILCLLALIILFILIKLGINYIHNIKDKKINNKISELSSEKVDYVFVEINPSLVLMVENEKIKKVSCLNNDCMTMLSDLHINNMKIMDGINDIYELAREKSFDTSKGVKIKSTTYIEAEKYNYDFITVEYITEKQKDNLLEEVIGSKDELLDNGTYYEKLWTELKKDSDYSKVYDCKMDNNELECNFIKKAITPSIIDIYADFINVDEWLTSGDNVIRTLKKFGFNVKKDEVEINGVSYGYSPVFYYNDEKHENVLITEPKEKLSDEYCEFVENKNCIIKTGVQFIEIGDMNLVNPIINSNNIIFHSNGLKEEIVNQYNVVHWYEIENEKKEKEIEEDCLSKGYHKEMKKYEIDEEPFEMWCTDDGYCVSYKCS